MAAIRDLFAMTKDDLNKETKKDIIRMVLAAKDAHRLWPEVNNRVNDNLPLNCYQSSSGLYGGHRGARHAGRSASLLLLRLDRADMLRGHAEVHPCMERAPHHRSEQHMSTNIAMNQLLYNTNYFLPSNSEMREIVVAKQQPEMRGGLNYIRKIYEKEMDALWPEKHYGNFVAKQQPEMRGGLNYIRKIYEKEMAAYGKRRKSIVA
ncbi:hypothetical protein CAPTEDRAFT_186759 [Capitella teleta]|uniref:Uncharacterized protein n=1 Tax=Capitella teleta TaxID=283909 RepID=R7TYJ3_CAPTE|nr:hypothetical protein CAPTEDRAFT_186759 [Capitella teleta]|eukprot:ELT98697.1 hypothetical protein CAPTEDRAFT_186759 [Capitella teleta]